MLDNIRADLKANTSPISKALLLVYRYGNWVYYQFNAPIVKRGLWISYKVLDLIIIKIIAGADIPARCKIGKGLILPHGGKGVVIHPNTVISDNVQILHQVTLGADGLGNSNAPYIGSNVFIGAGAKVLGHISIGNESRIGANAVVLKNVPDSSVAVGVPAKTLPMKDLI